MLQNIIDGREIAQQDVPEASIAGQFGNLRLFLELPA